MGREIQSRIYRNGVFGGRPVVPVEPAALEAAAQRRMSRKAWAYVAGSAGQQRTARANLEAFDRHRIVPRMPGVVEEVDDRIPVLFDSGVRSGADAFKALALGAQAVLVGRPWVYGLALGGSEGAVR